MGVVISPDKVRTRFRERKQHRLWYWALEYAVHNKVGKAEGRAVLRKIPEQLHQQVVTLAEELYGEQL